MSAPLKGQRLYLNVSASEARRRLKGLGYGIRKIQSAGRNQSVVIHTATGQHERELKLLLKELLIPEPESPAVESNSADEDLC